MSEAKPAEGPAGSRMDISRVSECNEPQVVRGFPEDRQGHSRNRVKEGCERESNKRKDGTFHGDNTTTRTTHHYTPTCTARVGALIWSHPGDWITPDRRYTGAVTTEGRGWLNLTSTRTRHKSQTRDVNTGDDHPSNKGADHLSSFPYDLPYRTKGVAVAVPDRTKMGVPPRRHHLLYPFVAMEVYFTSSLFTVLDLPKWFLHDNPQSSMETSRGNQQVTDSATSFTHHLV